MGDSQLDRVEADLETVRQAAGLTLPFGREDIIMDLLMVAGIIVLGVWSMFERGPWLRAASLVFLALGTAGHLWLRIKYRRGSGRPAMRRKEYTISVVGGTVLFLGLMFFSYMTRDELQRRAVYPAVLLSLAFAGMIIGIFDPSRRRYLAAATTAVLLGIVIAVFWHNPAQLIVAVCAGCAMGGLTDAGIMAWQLRRARAAV